MTIRSASASTASAALAGVTVRQVINRLAAQFLLPTNSPTLSQSSASRAGAICSNNADIAAIVGMVEFPCFRFGLKQRNENAAHFTRQERRLAITRRSDRLTMRNCLQHKAATGGRALCGQRRV